MEMTKAERLEHTRSRLDAISICRLYDRIARKKAYEKTGGFSICKRCGVKHNIKFMHFSIMYDGFICNNSVECLKDKQMKEDEKICSICGTQLLQEYIETYHYNQNGEPLYVPVWICPICDFGEEK